MILALGAPLHLEHKETLNRLLPGCFYELYGLTEGFVTVLDKLDYPKKPASVGIPLPLFEMKIVERIRSRITSQPGGRNLRQGSHSDARVL